MTALQSSPVIPSTEPKFLWGIVCSSLVHLLLLVLLVGVPSFSSPKRTYFSSAYRVKLVEGPARRPGRMKVSKTSESKTKKVTAAEPSKKKSKKAVQEKKTNEKKSATLSVQDGSKKRSAVKTAKRKPKKKDLEGSFALALDKIRKKVDERRKEEAIDTIRNRIADAESREGMGDDESALGLSGMPPGGGMVANLPLNYRLYYQTIEQKIKNNWNLALPRGIIEDMRGMEVVISITIRSDGEITDVSFEEKTGNVYLDDSAYRAVKKSSPLPPFSEFNIREPFFETGIVFPTGELL